MLFDPATGQTRAMRSKEEAHDYRYFTDPDLLPLVISPAWIDEVKAGMPELPEDMRLRFIKDYRLPEYDSLVLTSSKGMADYFEDATRSTMAMAKTVLGMGGQEPVLSGVAKLVSNWLMGEMSAVLKDREMFIEQSPVSPAQLARLLIRILDQTINNKAAKDVFSSMWNGEGLDPDALIETKGLKQISDTGALEKIIEEVLAANPRSVEEFRAGKEKAFNALVGQAMKATKGKGNPQQVNELLRRKLG